jgi:uncharacterized protein (TIRG00374 family)
MIVGSVVFVLYLYFFVGLGEMLAALEQMNYLQFFVLYSLAIAAALLGIVLFSASWRRLLSALSIKISLTKAFQYHSVGNFVDLVVPCQTVCGEITRVQLVYTETHRQNYGQILASAFVNRILVNIINVFGLSAGAIIILLGQSSVASYVIDPLLVVMIGTLIYNAILISMAVRHGTAKKLLSGFLRFVEIITFKRFKREKLLARAQGPLLSFETGFQMFRDDPKCLVVPAILLFFSWVFSVLSFVLVFYALGYWFLPIHFFLMGFSVIVSIQGVAATLSVGILDIFMTEFLSLYNVTIGASGVAVLLARFVVFWFQIVLGYVIIQWVGARSLLSASSDQKTKK